MPNLCVIDNLAQTTHNLELMGMLSGYPFTNMV